MLKAPVRGHGWQGSWLGEICRSDGQKRSLRQPFLQEVSRRWQNIQAPQHCLLVKRRRESLFLLLGLLIKVYEKVSEGTVQFFTVGVLYSNYNVLLWTLFASPGSLATI